MTNHPTPSGNTTLKDLEEKNVIQIILEKMMKDAPDRFTDFPAVLGDYTSLPFEMGDTVSFDLLIQSANQQVEPKTYTITFLLTEFQLATNPAYETARTDHLLTAPF